VAGEGKSARTVKTTASAGKTPIALHVRLVRPCSAEQNHRGDAGAIGRLRAISGTASFAGAIT